MFQIFVGPSISAVHLKNMKKLQIWCLVFFVLCMYQIAFTIWFYRTFRRIIDKDNKLYFFDCSRRNYKLSVGHYKCLYICKS